MEQALLFSGLLLVAFALGFYFGQSSIKLVGQRVEVQHPSDRRSVAEWAALEPGKVHYAPSEENPGPSMIPPPRYKDLVIKMRNGGDN